MEVVQTWVDFLVEEGIIGVEYKFTKPFIFLIREKRAKSEEKEEYTWDTFKNDFYLEALEKNIPEDKITLLWSNKVDNLLHEKKNFFIAEAARRGFKKPEELWNAYLEVRKNGGDFKTKEQVTLEEFVVKDIILFLNEYQVKIHEAETPREEEVPLLYTGTDFRKDLEVALASNDLNKAKSIFESCKASYMKASGEKKQQTFKTLNELYSRIKEYLKSRKKQSLEGEISLTFLPMKSQVLKEQLLKKPFKSYPFKQAGQRKHHNKQRLNKKTNMPQCDHEQKVWLKRKSRSDSTSLAG